MKLNGRSKLSILALSGLTGTMMLFQNCGEVPGFKPYRSANEFSSVSPDSMSGSAGGGGTAGSGSVSSPGPDDSPTLKAFKETLEPILKNNCFACHGFDQAPLLASVNPAHSHDNLIFFDLVDSATPSNSRVVQKIRAGHAGIPLAVADQIRDGIMNWRDRERAIANQMGLPSRFGDRNHDSLEVLPTFNSIANKILIPKCVGCHGPVAPAAGKRFDTYAETMKSVVPRSPNTSPLYAVTQSGRMPQAPNPALRPDETSAIFTWIANGATSN